MIFGDASRILLNIVIALSGALILQLLVRDKSKRSVTLNRAVFGLIMAVDLVLCMSFPFNFASDFRLDLRTIPMLVGILYSDYGVGLFLFVVFAVSRLTMWGGMPWTAILVFGSAMAVAVVLKATYRTSSQTRKLLLASIPMTIAVVASDIIIHASVLNSDYLDSVLGIYSIVNFVVLWVTIALIEYAYENFRVREEIHRAEKYHVMGELAASIAHEIRNPMTVARGFLQLAEESHDTTILTKTYLHTAIEELDRAHLIISEYLAFAKPSLENLTVVDASDQLQHAVDVLRPYASLHNVSILHTVEPNLTVLGSPQKLAQLLINICKNGIEAMPQGGDLVLEARQVNGCVEIAISDTGIGMTGDELQRLGNPFYSTKANGTGLGLMTSYRICHAMNGHIKVDSQRGKGTSFLVSIPLALPGSEDASSVMPAR